jgi:hypothetical protein
VLENLVEFDPIGVANTSELDDFIESDYDIYIDNVASVYQDLLQSWNSLLQSDALI